MYLKVLTQDLINNMSFMPTEGVNEILWISFVSTVQSQRYVSSALVQGQLSVQYSTSPRIL